MKSKKYPKVKWNPTQIKRMWRAGKRVSEIAQAVGYPPNTGQNRIRTLLEKAGIYKSPRK